jgi:hypothetical protein
MRLVTYLSVDDRRPLASITKLCRESFRIEKALTELVLVARDQGHTWTEIGGALGTTKQAAWRRFVRGPLGELRDPSVDRRGMRRIDSIPSGDRIAIGDRRSHSDSGAERVIRLERLSDIRVALHHFRSDPVGHRRDARSRRLCGRDRSPMR